MTPVAPGGWDNARNLLCVRLDSIGDVLMTLPAIRSLRAAAPGRRVTLLTSPAGAEVAALAPEIDEVIPYTAPWMKAALVSIDNLSFAAGLRDRGFDAACIFTVYSQSSLPAALLCQMAEIPLRAAYARENPYHLLTHWQPEREPEYLVRHEVRRQLDLAATLGAEPRPDQRIAPGGTALARAGALLARAGLPGETNWAIVCPGATAESRRYSPRQFAAALARLQDEHGYRFVFSGTASESAISAEIGRDLACSLDLTGRTDLATLHAIMSLAPIVIANNSGPAHLGAAAGTPVVCLYALTNPQHAPWGVPARLLFADQPCRFCYRSVCPEGHHRCLADVHPDRVVEAVVGTARPAQDAVGGTTPPNPAKPVMLERRYL